MHKTAPRLQNGLLVSKDVTGQSANANVVTSPLQNSRPSPILAWPADSAEVTVFDVSVGADHKIAVAMQSADRSNQLSWQIAMYDESGSLAGQFRMNPFSAEQVAIDREGAIWVLGVDHDAVEKHQDYNIVRKYSPEGQLLASVLPRSSFATEFEPAVWTGGKLGPNFLFSHRVGVSVYFSQTHEWVELSGSGSVASRLRLQMPVKPGFLSEAHSFATLADDSVFLQAAGWVLCRLDTSSGICSQKEGPASSLLGGENNELVFHDFFQPGSDLYFLRP